MWDKVKGFFARINEAVQNRLDSWFSREDGKRSLLDYVANATWGLIKLPFVMIGGTVGGVHLLFTDPGAFVQEAKYQWWRGYTAAGYLLGYRQIDGDRDMTRFAIGIYCVIIGFCFAPLFIEAGWVKTGIGCVVVPIAAWISSGWAACSTMWKRLNKEMYSLEKTAYEETAKVQVERNKDAAAQRVVASSAAKADLTLRSEERAQLRAEAVNMAVATDDLERHQDRARFLQELRNKGMDERNIAMLEASLLDQPLDVTVVE